LRLSLRARLTAAFALGTVVVLAALGAFLFEQVGRDLLASIDQGLRSRAQVIAAGVGQGSFADGSGRSAGPPESFAQVLDPSRASPIVESSPAVGTSPVVPAASLSRITAPTFLQRQVAGIGGPVRVIVVPTREAGRTLYVVAGATLAHRDEALRAFVLRFALGAPIAVVVASFAGWLVAGRALRPVERIRSEAAAISASEPDRRLPIPTGDRDLQRLATTLNEMLARLQHSLARERRIVDDASHELRTPLAVLKGELDVARTRPRSRDELEAIVARASSETDRLARLANDLLVLARSSGGRVPVRLREVPLSEAVTAACRALEPRFEAAGVGLTTTSVDDIVRIDPERLRQALENLLDNALRHTPPGGCVRVTGRRCGAEAVLTVEDSGRGFPEGFEARAFEPFARADRGSEGTGLGLAIVRAVAEAHGGRATAENLPTGGARVILTLRS
jgi:two-component system OmpR family sensor kinase